MSRTLRTALTTAAIALALTACSNPRTAPEVSAAGPATSAPVTVEALAPETAADAETAPVPAQPAPAPPAPAPAAPAPAPVPAAVPVAEPTRCSTNQGPDGGQYMVSGIAADDADGGLVVRAFAGTSSEARGVLANFAAVDTYVDDAEWASCLVAANGSIWWEINHPDFATGGWVNADYLEPLADDHVDQPEEEADAHADCVIFFGDDECVLAYYAAGELTFVEPYSTEAAGELHLACAYNGNTSACDVLAFTNEGDGIGNALTQAPTEFLMDDCDNLTGIDQKLACAELADRS